MGGGCLREKLKGKYMALRRDIIFWQIPATSFQEFDHGLQIESWVPISWNLKVGDRLYYEAGSTIIGIAEVKSVGSDQRMIIDPSVLADSNSKVAGIACEFIKIN